MATARLDSFSIRISEISDQDGINPQPSDKTESEFLLEEFLSPQRLREISEKEDLNEVTYLQMIVDTTENSLGNFGSYMPNLKELDLSNSVLTSVRDMGSSLAKLEVLWLRKCQLVELDGLSTFYNLTELYLSYNHINNLSDLSMMEKLRTLDLEANDIDDIEQLLFIAMCGNLHNLGLLHNPICQAPKPMLPFDPDYNYRSEVKKILPQIKFLDDVPIQDESQNFMQLDEDLQLVTENIKCGVSSESNSDRPQSSFGRPATARRPASALISSRRPASAMPGLAAKPMFGFRPGTANFFDRPGTAARNGPLSTPRPDTSSSVDSTDSAIELDEFSKLTSGQVLCGNPIKALRNKRAASSKKRIQTSTVIPEEVAVKCDTSEDTFDQLLNEMKDWKMEFEHKSGDLTNAELKLSNEVNILTLSEEGDATTPAEKPERKATSARRRQFQHVLSHNSDKPYQDSHDEAFDDVDSGLCSSRADAGTPSSEYDFARGPIRSAPKPPRPPLRPPMNPRDTKGQIRSSDLSKRQENNHKLKPVPLPPHRLISTRPKSSSATVSDAKFC